MSADEEMMAAICAGDRDAYGMAVNRHLRLISAYCFRMLGNRSDAEDVTQETFLRLWTQAQKWRPELASVSTWLHRIAHNLCIDTLRKDKSAISDVLTETFADDTETGELLEQQSRLNQLRSAMDSLPERQRNALVLNQFQGLSNREVAIVMDISVEALESLLARARRTLKQQLHEPDRRKELV